MIQYIPLEVEWKEKKKKTILLKNRIEWNEMEDCLLGPLDISLEEIDGEFVASKIFYQTQPRQHRNSINNVRDS
ncbi:hypothetical protein MTR_3g022390 [Medicago truncatula]|uniref:Uncharacterized protein n=1 Tax=Medicago truncatula TaxID=3880 RepID=G7IZ78_MEDTR|nr:hypothetical protein MTR_3g022390 [Medicago truncatula]